MLQQLLRAIAVSSKLQGLWKGWLLRVRALVE